MPFVDGGACHDRRLGVIQPRREYNAVADKVRMKRDPCSLCATISIRRAFSTISPTEKSRTYGPDKYISKLSKRSPLVFQMRLPLLTRLVTVWYDNIQELARWPSLWQYASSSIEPSIDRGTLRPRH